MISPEVNIPFTTTLGIAIQPQVGTSKAIRLRVDLTPMLTLAEILLNVSIQRVNSRYFVPQQYWQAAVQLRAVGGSLLGLGALGAWAAHNNQRPKIDPTKPLLLNYLVTFPLHRPMQNNPGVRNLRLQMIRVSAALMVLS